MSSRQAPKRAGSSSSSSENEKQRLVGVKASSSNNHKAQVISVVPQQAGELTRPLLEMGSTTAPAVNEPGQPFVVSPRSMTGDHRPAVGVSVYCVLTKLQTVEELATYDFAIYFHYTLPKEDIKKTRREEGGQDGWVKVLESAWRPEWEFYNSPNQELILELYRMQEDTGLVVALKNWVVTVVEPLELHYFPFDRQILKVDFTADNARLMTWSLPADLTLPLPGGSEPRLAAVVVYQHATWKLDPPLARITPGCRRIELPMSRCPTPYLFNTVVVVWIIVHCNVVVVGLEPSELSNRMSVTLTLLLTTVAFKLVTNGFVPTVTYQTLLDRYLNTAFLLQGTVVLESFAVALITKEGYSSMARRADVYFAYAFTGLWNVIHLLVCLGTWRGWFYPSWSAIRKSDNQEEQTKKVAKWT